MKIALNFTSDTIYRGDMKNFMKISLDVSEDKQTPNQSRKPVYLIPVLDKSGSMDSPATTSGCDENYLGSMSFPYARHQFTYPAHYTQSKLQCAQEATVELLDMLQDGDKFAVIAFDDNVEVTQKPIIVNSKNRKEIASNIRKIRTCGCTNISQALMRANELIKQEDIKNFTCKIILLSDGEANAGYITEIDFAKLMSKILHRGITTSSIGLGLDYNLAIMEAISGNCAGSFHHIHKATSIKDIFAKELRAAQQVACKNAIVSVKLPTLVAFKPNFNNYGEDITKDEIRIMLGDLYADKNIYYEFSVLDDTAAKAEITVNVEYESVTAGQNTVSITKELIIVDNKDEVVANEKILEELMDAVKDKYYYDATKAASMSDTAYATSSLNASVATMDSIATVYNTCSANTISVNNAIDEMQLYSQTVSTADTNSNDFRRQFSKMSKKMRGQ